MRRVAALAAHDGGGTCGSQVWRLEAVRDRIDAEIAQLSELRDSLTSVTSVCVNGCCALSPVIPLAEP